MVGGDMTTAGTGTTHGGTGSTTTCTLDIRETRVKDVGPGVDAGVADTNGEEVEKTASMDPGRHRHPEW